MVRRSIFLILALSGFVKADTGFYSTVQVTETDNSPKCQAGQLKVSAGTLSCSGNVANINTGSGIVSPGTFTWTNNFGISLSTLTASSATISGLYGSSFTFRTANSSITWIQDSNPGHEELVMKGNGPSFSVFGNNGSYYGYNTSDGQTRGSISFAPHTSGTGPGGNTGSGNYYMRDGSHLLLDTTGDTTLSLGSAGDIMLRTADAAREGHPMPVLVMTSTKQVIVTDLNSTDFPYAKPDLSAVFATSSTTRGAQPCPPMTTAQKNAIVTPSNGLCVYDVNLSSYAWYSKPTSQWVHVGSGGAGTNPAGNDREVQFNNSSVFGSTSGFKLTTGSELQLYNGAIASNMSLNSSAGGNLYFNNFPQSITYGSFSASSAGGMVFQSGNTTNGDIKFIAISPASALKTSLFRNDGSVVFSSNTIMGGTTTYLDGAIVTPGTVRSTRTTDFGWTVVDATDDQACNTGCTSACVFGWNITAGNITDIVGCADTTADKCLCAGPS